VQFVLQPGRKADSSDATGLGFFTSFDFNPKDSSQIVVGFINGSPRIYKFNGNSSEYSKVSSQDQPSYQNNPKTVRFMPDGQRVFSSDDQLGVGLWPGDPTQSLVYNNSYHLFKPTPFDGGQRVLGYNWQSISIAEIQYQCPGSSGAGTTTCKCGEG
jgi:hypothetical protein